MISNEWEFQEQYGVTASFAYELIKGMGAWNNRSRQDEGKKMRKYDRIFNDDEVLGAYLIAKEITSCVSLYESIVAGKKIRKIMTETSRAKWEKIKAAWKEKGIHPIKGGQS